jgi:hypothetical protein
MTKLQSEKFEFQMDVGEARAIFSQELQRQKEIVSLLSMAADNATQETYAAGAQAYAVDLGFTDAPLDRAKVIATEWLQAHLLQDLLDSTSKFVESCLNQCAFIDAVNGKSMSLDAVEEAKAQNQT